MDLPTIIDAVASEADELLAGVTTMTEARPMIREHLKEKFPRLGVADTPRVVAGILAILDEEGFFAATPGDDS